MTPEPSSLTPEALAERLKKGERTELLDVRPAPEYRLLHIEGARPATRKLVDEMFESWPKDTPIVLCDHFGPRALDAARVLAMRGFTDVRTLEGGLDAWSQKIDPLLPRYP